MSVDAAGLGALGVVAAEWLALGWLSGLSFPSAFAQVDLPARAATWAVRLLVGALLVAVAQLLLASVGLGFGVIPGVLAVAAAAAIAIRLLVRMGPVQGCPGDATTAAAAHAQADANSSVVGRERVGWLLLAAILLAALVRSVLVPESGWDAYSHWGLRAQAFANAATLVDAHSEHEYYPPLVPLLEAWLYLHRGQVAIDLGKTIWALVGGAFGICLAWQLRTSLRPGAAWLAPYLAAAIVLATPELLDGFWTGQADLELTVYLTLATLAVWQWQRAPDRRWLIQAGIFSAAVALSKFEGLPRLGLVGVVLVVEALWTRQLWRAWPPILSLLGPALAASLVWTAFQVSHGIPANAEHIGGLQLLALGGVLAALVAVFGGVRTGGGVLLAVIACAVAAHKLLVPPLRLLALVALAQAAGTLLAFLLSSTAPDVEVLTSATRLVEQFLPVALFAVALGLVRTGHL
jgi:hypothetical protein